MSTTTSLHYSALETEDLRRVLVAWNRITRVAGLVPAVYRDRSVSVKCEDPYFSADVPPMFATIVASFSELCFGTTDERSKVSNSLELMGA